MKEQLSYEIDNVDRNILSLLQHDARRPYTEIAKKLLSQAELYMYAWIN